uniref:Uncharacterized protein n=1 Tax=Anopheles maculatus TaxID=74869 RepID=A0A182SPX3_9DIPT
MDKKADKLQLIDAKHNHTSNALNETTSEEEQAIQITTEIPIPALPATTLWQRWNRTDFLARIIDDILKPAQERITLVFQTLVPKDGADNVLNSKQVSTDERLNSTTKDDASDELGADLEPLQHESEPALFEPAMNGSSLLGQFQARRNVIRRRVAKALSSITGLLILAANTRREGNARSTRSIQASTSEDDDLWTDEQHRLVAFPYSERIEAVQDDDPNETKPRRNAESVAIFLLEVFGSMAGFSWGIFKQVQSFFWYAVS